jgi:DNA replication licensing factor MCM6
MDFDGPTSPGAYRSSLPPSSAPLPTQSSLSSKGRRSTPNRPRATADALAFGDEEGGRQGEDGETDGAKKRKSVRGQMIGDIPLVKDVVGESVAESFETFLKTFVHFNVCNDQHSSALL